MKIQNNMSELEFLEKLQLVLKHSQVASTLLEERIKMLEEDKYFIYDRLEELKKVYRKMVGIKK